MPVQIVDDLESDTAVEDRSNYKRKTAELDDLASANGLICGLPVGMFVYNGLTFSPSFLESVIRALGGTVPEVSFQEKPPQKDGEWVLHRSWSIRRQWKGKWGFVEIWRNERTNKFVKDFHTFVPWQVKLEMLAMTTATNLTFGIEEAEIKARQKLETLLSPSQRRSYLLCESFYEKSRSGLIYWLRKNRPTVAFRMDEDSKNDGQGTPLCALCLHPLGWYTNSFAGIMAPSDDIMAHLLMIRSNEHFFWRKANQHPLHSLFAGLG